MRATQERGWKMRKIKAKTTEVLAKIEANYKKHVEEYAEAFELYKVEFKRLAESKIESLRGEMDKLIVKVNAARIETDKPVKAMLPSTLISFHELPVPQSHAKDYVQVIEMLKMEVSETIEMESDEFSCYVLDDWEWKGDFDATNSLYKAGASR